jgi:tape measure domain-containing protein
MADYRYNVIVDVSINPQTNQGKTQIRGALNQIEQEVKRSINNQKAQEKELNDYHSRLSAQRRQTTIDNFHQQEMAHKEFVNDSIALENNKNQQLAANNRSYHQQRFRDMKEANDREEALNKLHAARQKKLLHDVQMGSRGMIYSPDQIRSQTASQGSGQTRLFNFAQAEIAGGLEDIDRILKGQKIADANRSLNQLTATTAKSTDALGMWGQAFKGAFIGAIAGITFSTIIGGITGIARALADAAIASVQFAGDFQQTTRALEVFTGSTRLAKSELANIGEIVKSVPGLKLPDAEVGYQRLRALGFEAKIASGFIKELGEEKILSGADDEAVGRVIFNFAQLASGGQKVSQELREIVTQMPTLRRVFQDAFGSINYGEIQKVLDANPDEFFQRLIDTMAKGESATGGFNSGLTDLTNALTRAGRLFGEPLLDPLTESIQDLTVFLDNNKHSWMEWGQSVGDSIRGVSEIWKGVAELPLFGSILGKEGQDAARDSLFGLAGFLGKRSRERQEEINKPFGGKFIGGDASILKTDEQREAERAASVAEDKAYRIAETARKRELTLLKESGQSRIAILKDRASVELALAESVDAQTLDQIAKKNKRISDLEQSHISQEIQRQSDYFNSVINLTTDTDEVAKLTLERNEKISSLNTQLRISEIEEAKQTREDLRNILRQRRDDTIAFYDLESRSIQQALDKRSFDIERSLELETGDYNAHYRRLVDVTTEAYIEQSRVVREQLNLKLQDETLTDEQIVNLRTSTFLELENLTEQNRQRTIQIEKRRLDQYVQETNRAVQQTERLFSSRSSQLGGLGSLFSAESVASGTSGRAGSDFLSGIFEPINRVFEEGGKAVARLTEINEIVGKLDAQKDFKQLFDLKEESESLAKVARSFQALGQSNLRGIPEVFEKIVVQSRELKTTSDFDTLAKDVLTFQQTLESASLDKKIATLNAQFANGAITAQDFGEQMQDAFSDRTSLAIKQATENAQLYANSLVGLKNTIKELSDPNSASSLGLQRVIEGQSLQSIIGTITELRETQFRIANPAYDEFLGKMDIEIAKGQDLLEFRNREIDITIRSNRAKLELQDKLIFSQTEANARLLEFFAQQKGITDIVSDARINLLTTAYSGLESVVGRLTQRFGIFADAIRETITNLIKLALNPFLRKLFGGGGQGGSGGFSMPGVFGVGVGGGGIGGTPNFNPQMMFGGNGANALGLGGGGYGGGFGGFGGFSTGGHEGGHLLGAGLSHEGGHGLVGGTGKASFGGLLQGLLPMLGVGGGSALGGGTGLGGILGGVGGGILGLVGGAFGSSSTAFGGAFGSIGGFLGISGAATLGIGAAIGGAILLGAYLIGKNSARRKDETTRNQAMIDALKGLDNILDGVRSDRIDGQTALQQADQIRATYVEQMTALKDKKTRRIALADVSRLDAKIGQIKSAVADQESRKARLELSIPTFASGGSLGKYSNSNHVYNPQGYQSGGQKFGYFPSAGMTASFNERGSEYILDAETTKNVGIPELDKMRASRGRYNPQAYMGGLPSNPSGGGSGMPKIENHIVINQNADGTITVEAVKSIIKQNDGSETQITSIVNSLTTRNGQNLNKLARSVDEENRRGK